MKTAVVISLFLLATTGCASNPNSVAADGYSTTEVLTGAPSPTVIIAHGCGGFDQPSFYNWAQDFKSWGYNAILVDSFTPRGFPRGMCGTNNVRPTVRAMDMENVAKWIRQQPWHKGNVVLVGFSHGGTVALNVSSNPNITQLINAAVIFYPNCKRPFVGRDYSRAYMPVQVHLGEGDTVTPSTECLSTFTNQTYYIYPNAIHSFDVPLPYRVRQVGAMGYDSQSHQISKTRVQQFIKENTK